MIFLISKGQEKGYFVDKRDGKTYKTVKIGDQIWMAENLNYDTIDSWCYENIKRNCDHFGRLYRWECALDACPDGWHLPSEEEINKLLNNYGSAGYNALKAGGISNFSALVSEKREIDGELLIIGNYGSFWSSTIRHKSYGLFLIFDSFTEKVYLKEFSTSRYSESKRAFVLSVRCLKDYGHNQ